MRVDIGEQIVGAYLKVVLGCDLVTYNVRPPGGKLAGLEELDVIGFKFEERMAYLCEVTTHIGGMLYSNGNSDSLARMVKKHERQKAYASRNMPQFKEPVFQLWSPRVGPKLAESLRELYGENLIINEEYTRRIDELMAKAEKQMNDENNDAFRMLQILAHLKRSK